jgi:aryl-alcohol dehydrogenase-like predicted oxidoreductase
MPADLRGAGTPALQWRAAVPRSRHTNRQRSCPTSIDSGPKSGLASIDKNLSTDICDQFGLWTSRCDRDILTKPKMKYRTYRNTDLTVSEVGFGLWTVSTGWWGDFTQDQAVRLMRKAFDLGITLYDAADTYGNGLSEELIAKAFGDRRDQIVIATKIGYDFVHHGNERRGQREIPQDFSPDALVRATEAALRRLQTDRIDLLQLHNIRMEQVHDDSVWETLEKLRDKGWVRFFGIALGPAIGWMYEGINCVRERQVTSVQHIYNMLEQHPGSSIQDAAIEFGKDTMFLIRVPHSSGMLEGHYTLETKFPPGDHRSHRPRSWLVNGVKKVEQLRFLESPTRTLGQSALLWLLKDERVASVLPNIYDENQLSEFAATSEATPLTAEEMEKAKTLYDSNFGIQNDDPPKFKGTMSASLTAVSG